ncbi:MAG: ABC transporter substrate-binding protein [Oscillospiraceae bacterium]|nr:ABC transporter substrate-binding protein [Oscillospiraceae bacterium]
MKKVFALLLVLLLTFTLFASCSKKDSDSGSSSQSSSSSNSSNQTTATPSGEKILVMGLSSVDGVFNPILSDQVYDSYVCSCIFDGLVDNDKFGEYIPGLATWEVSADRLTYTFTLKDGVAFSDGTPLTAEDVEFTYVTIAHPDYNGPRSYAVDMLLGYEEYNAGETDVFEGIKVIDEKTISFTFTEEFYGEPVASPANIECFVYGIMSKDYYAFDSWEQFEALNDNPMGSGFLVFDSWALNDFVKLNTNMNYWDESRALKIDGVLLTNVPEDSLIGALSTGDIDFGQLTATQENWDEAASTAGIVPLKYLGNGYTFLCFNTLKPMLADLRVRQALMYALDRKSFIAAYYGADLAMPGLAPISPSSWAFPDISEMNDYAFDLDKAGELLDDAGWLMGSDGYRYKDGNKFEIHWLVYEDSPWPGVLSGMAYDTWKQVGIDLIIEKMDFNSVADKTMDAEPEDRDFDIYTMGFSLSIDPDPRGALFDADASAAGGFNASGFRDDRSQELMMQGRAEFDQAKRAAIYKEWAALQNDLIPTVIIAYRFEIWGINERVKGLDIGTYFDWVQCLPDVTID